MNDLNFHVSVCGHYLHSLLTAAEQASISELQRFFGTRTLLSFNLQTAKVAFIDGQRLKSLFGTQVTLMDQMETFEKIISGYYQSYEGILKTNSFMKNTMHHCDLQQLVWSSPSH